MRNVKMLCVVMLRIAVNGDNILADPGLGRMFKGSATCLALRQLNIYDEVILRDPERKETGGHRGVQNSRVGYRLAGGAGSRLDGENQGAYRAFEDTQEGFSLPQRPFEDGRTPQTIAPIPQGQ